LTCKDIPNGHFYIEHLAFQTLEDWGILQEFDVFMLE
jgi:hypothetical protein